MGRPFLLDGLRARVSSWPPLRLVRLRCERVSVGVVPSQRFPNQVTRHGRENQAVVRYVGMDVAGPRELVRKVCTRVVGPPL